MRIRLDRLATLYVVSPLQRLTFREDNSIPILMYHSISDDDQAHLHPYYRTATSPAAFFEQMEFLHKCKYQVCSLTEAAALLKSSTTSAGRRVVITFDDGFRDFFQAAFPVLSEFNFTATVFLPTYYIGETALQFKGKDCLTWAEVRELQRYGITFGSHTVTHPQLRNLSRELVEEEVTKSKLVIEEKTGRTVESFAYPYAFPQSAKQFKKTLHELLCQAGYGQGVCTILGRADARSDQLFMERLPMNSCDDSALFDAKLSGAYDWVSIPQSAVQLLKSLRARP